MSEPEAPQPVPQCESLTVSGNPVRLLHDNGRLACRIARTAEDEAVVVYQVREHVHDVLYSRRIRKAFSSWPPETDGPVEHQRGEFGNNVGELTAWPDGTFAIRTGAGWIFAAAGEAGARYSVRGQVFPDLEQGMYVLEHDEGRVRVVHRSVRAAEAHASGLGHLPKDVSVYAATAVSDGLLLITGKLVKEGKLKMQVLKASPTGVAAGAVLSTGSYRYLYAVPRPEGGAFIVLPSWEQTLVCAVTEDGTQIGEPWRYFSESMHDHVMAVSSWRGGLSLATLRGGDLGAVLFDGGHATYSENGVQSRMIAGVQRAGITSSSDGRIVLVSYNEHPTQGIARLVCEAKDPATAYRPAKRGPVRDPNPPPATPPKPKVVPSPMGTRDEIVRRVREIQALAVLSAVRTDWLDSSWEGDLRAGCADSHDGSGNHTAIFWDDSGVVALGFTHDIPESEYSLPLEERNPGQYLPGLPTELTALAERATEYGERLATEGFWVSAGPEPAHGKSSLDMLDLFIELARKRSEDPLGGDSPLGHLAALLANRASYTLTAVDSDALLTTDIEGGVLKIANVERVVKALAQLGVTWPGAIEAAQAQIASDAQQRDARLTPPDRDLFAAAHGGDLTAVERALATGANIDCAMPKDQLPYTPDGVTPLIVALRAGHTAIAEHLIDAGANLELDAPAWGGMIYPLRVAAEQGNVTLCRKLLDRGASVRPQVSSWGILQQLAYGDHSGKSAAPTTAYAAVIEMMLDAGAPLPNDAHCDTLVKVVEAGNASHLVARLRRSYAADELPASPPPIDVEANAGRISEALEQAERLLATDSVASLKLLVEAWQASMSPRICEAAERLAKITRGSSFTYFVPARGGIDGQASHAALVSARQQEPDPRAARAILKYLWTSDIYTQKTWLAKCDDAAAALLVTLRDLRFTESLEQHCALRRPISSIPARASLHAAARMLKEMVPATLSEADKEHLGGIEDWLASRKPAARRPATRELFDAVYQSPDQDEPRHILAARLCECGDPRGELIRLQLERHRTKGKVTKGEKALLKEHGRHWLGELGPILADDFLFERGFLWQAATADRPDGQHAAHSHPILPSGGGTQIEWSTVRRLSLWRHAGVGTMGLLRGSKIQGLRELVDVPPSALEDILAGAPRPLERLDLAHARNPDFLQRSIGDRIAALPEILPALRRLRVSAADVESLARLCAPLAELRDVAVGFRRLLLAELIAFAKERNLERATLLGPVDFTWVAQTGALQISFAGKLAAQLTPFIAKALDSITASGTGRVEIVVPPRASVNEEASGEPPRLTRRSESLELQPILDSASALGLPCETIPSPTDDFYPNPTRGD